MSCVHRLVQEAASPTLARIRRDRDRAPVRVRPLLEHLETHLFDPDLDAKRLKHACGVRDNTVATAFHQALSRPPYGYIEDCRMEVACRLLSDTDLKVWQIAHQLGYSTVQVFSRAFDRWAGLRPSAYRSQARRPTADRSGGATGQEGAGPRLETLLRAIRGQLRKDEADELSRHLALLYPDSFRPARDGTLALPSLRGLEP